MGFLKKARESAKAWGELVAEHQAMADSAEAAAPLTILNPTPQAEVDRLLAGDGYARGVVVRATHQWNDGERIQKMRVHVRVRTRLADGQLGEVVELPIWTSWQVTALLDPGLEIPIVVDRATGRPTDIPTDELKRELESRFDEAAERQPAWKLNESVQDPLDAARAVKKFLGRRKGGDG